MKTLNKLLLSSLLVIQSLSSNAQKAPKITPVPEVSNTLQNEFQISPRVGYDFPFFQNNTPFIEYKGGLELGLSVDYFWKNWGIGVDFDYIKNTPESTFDTENLFAPMLITNTTLTEDKITRMFYGFGPIYRDRRGKISYDVSAKIGLAGIKGGRVLLTDNTNSNPLNFHAGYDFKNKLASKVQAKVSYDINNHFSLNLGAYYLQHYYGEELSEGGVSSAYQPTTSGGERIFEGPLMVREEPCNCNIFSIGVFAGVNLKLPTKPRVPKEEKCDACATYSLAVTARDKLTKEVLPNTDVAVKNLQGEVVETGRTNSYGVVVFNGIQPDNYVIEGLLHDVKLDPSSTTTSEFISGTTLQKEIIYSDESFILEGNAVVCNTTEGIPGVKVKLLNKAEGVQKNAMTDDNGVYILHVKKNKIYTLSGKKDNYFSQVETIDTKDFDRNTTLFIKLEICMEKADCGKALALKNIHYDLDKYFIRTDAKPDLNRLVNFMKDNPTVKVEVSSHTDSRSSHEYNQTLSQNRANAAVDYLVSQGIARTRLSGVGYGETRLLNECADGVKCSKAQHQVNRRTEMKVICPN